MKRLERIKAILDQQSDLDKDSLEALIFYAYYYGRHTAAKECCDKAKEIFAEQQEAVKNCRYHKLAAKIQGGHRAIYHGDYSNDFVSMFANDDANFGLTEA